MTTTETVTKVKFVVWLYHDTLLMEFEGDMFWHGLQLADSLLVWDREGDAVIVGDAVPNATEVRAVRLPLHNGATEID